MNNINHNKMKNNTLSQSNRFHKKLYGLIILVLISMVGFSQNVGINATGAQPNPTAGLDVDFMNMGLLIPRVALTGSANAAPLAAKVAGMIIYNTATISDVKPGFYYNDGTNWIAGFPVGTSIGDMLYWNGTAWVKIPTGVSGQYLQLSGTNVPTWGGAASSSISTVALSAITGITATSGGNITNDGGSPVLARGVCWNTATSPTIANSKTTDGSGIGVYASNLTGLIPGTVYYIKAYSMNSNVITYGNELTFTTSATAPTMAATTAASLITGSTATSGGNVTSDGGTPITERGICWATTSTPTTASSGKVFITNPSPGTGTFTANLTGLSGGTTYYVRAYAINSVGTTYGIQISFVTSVVTPTLVTVAPTNILGATATSGGSMSWNGGGYSNYQNYGVCYSVTPNSATPTYISTNTSNFAVNPLVNITPWVTGLTGLTANTTYYIRSFLYVYKAGWSYIYGNELSFTTSSPTAPTIASTSAITNITANTGTSGGAISSDGGSPITAKGVCWGISANPTLGVGNFTSDGTGSNSFTSAIAGLTSSTLYYVRAYATNSIGTTYGSTDVTFTTWVQAPYTLGQMLSYGRVGYVAPDGSGFIVSPEIPSQNGWGCNGVNVTGTSTALGTGQANTAAILACSAGTTTAASVASSYNGGGFNDWYLPSSGDWAQIAANYYWYGLNRNKMYYTSSQYGTNYNYATAYFNTGSQAYLSGLNRVPTTSDLSLMSGIIAIRKFAAATLPTVTTNPVTSIAGATATSGGNVTNDGGAPILAAGVCWRTTSGPTVADSKTTDSNTTGSFVSFLTGLTSPTTYYVRAYSTNIAGTSYGSEVSFTTIVATLPTVTTNAITNLLGTSATTGGKVTADGGSAVINRGVCWDINPNPDISNPAISGIIYDNGNGLGAFVSNVTGLTNGQQYYVRAFAINGLGTAYGSDVLFTPTGNAIPTLTTALMTNPTSTSATFGGDITSDGGQPVTARGVCWSYTSYPPTIADSKTVNGTGTGIFTSNISGLIPGYSYWFAAYATNSLGTAYGQLENYLPIGIPTIATGQFTYTPLDNFAQLSIYVPNTGGGTLSAYGVVWGISTNPTVSSNAGITAENLANFMSSQNALISPISQNVTYYIRAYATNEIGTYYGPEITLTPGSLAIPTVITDPVINKIGAIAEGGGTISFDGGDPVIANGLCWSTSANPDLTNKLGYTNDVAVGGGTIGQYFSNLSGLTLGTTYHVRAYATNNIGTGYGADVSFVATPATVGQYLSGGLIYGNVFSIDATGLHGLIADQWGYGTSDWGCAGKTTGASGTAIGTGQANTVAINADILANGCTSTAQPFSAFASQIVLYDGIDWYLPSKDELNLMWTTRVASGLDANMSNAFPFWSSSESSATDAWYFDGTSWLNTGLKTAQYTVWPIRSF